MVLVVVQPQVATVATPPAANPVATNTTEIEQLMHRYTVDAQFRTALEFSFPMLADALRARDAGAAERAMQEVERRRIAEAERQRRMVMADPFDAQAQREIEEHIRCVLGV
jgi:hypothetical protein